MDPTGTAITGGHGHNVGGIDQTLSASGTYTVVVSDFSTNSELSGAYTLELSGTGITSVDNPGAGGNGGGSGGSGTVTVPLPIWSLMALAGGLLIVSTAAKKAKRGQLRF